MDHSLEDPLNLDSEMGVDFETSGDQVVSQSDISLDAGSHETTMPMEFEPIEEHPMLMDSENEQIIGYSDDQFNLQEYGIQQDDDTGANTTVVTSEPSISQAQDQTILDIQFDPQSFVSSTPKVESTQPKLMSVKTSMPPRFTALKKELVVMPRPVAIAPKPALPRPRLPAPRGLALAPRALVKKVQGAPNTVLAQIGKQLVMVPAGSKQKIKLVTSSGGVPNIQYIRTGQGDQAQLIATKNISGTAKPVLTKLIVQGQPHGDPSNQPAVLTKLMGASQPARLVTMTQKTVPISLPNKVLVTSPTKQTVRITKKPQFVEIKSPTQKLIATSRPSIGGPKKVVITASPAQNVLYKATTPVKATAQVNKDGAIQLQSTGQRTQLHQINVPGKGIQYIRLVTNSSAPRLKPLSTTRPATTIVLTDNKGNVIQMAGEKVPSTQPPPLVISGATLNKLAAKTQQKLVRIAPVGSKPAIAATQSLGRSAQSLLAPLSPVSAPASAPALAPASEHAAAPALAPAPAPEPAPSPPPPPDDMDSKAALRALIASTVGPGSPTQSTEEAEKSAENSESETSYLEKMEQPLIVIPNYLKPQQDVMSEDYNKDDGNRFNSFEAQSFNSFQEPPTPQALSESELVPTELGLRPRKACNCTKSQCLKLYCDCFANGEFCNRCNCNNCHNNLENEELRQKAIRGCLDRNPNAFRPKIGKAKSGGPEIVRQHNKGCNCKRSGCLKNYCECYEAKIACTAMCKCVGCRNVEDCMDRRRRDALRVVRDHVFRPPALPHINFMTTEVIEAVCQCLIAAAGEPAAAAAAAAAAPPLDPVRDVIDEFSRCLQDIIAAAHHAPLLDESRA